MSAFFRCGYFVPSAAAGEMGHPLYVPSRQGRGRVDDPLHEYRVLYVADAPEAAVAEAFGDFAVWTPVLFDPPPLLPDAERAVFEYEMAPSVCDLDDPKTLLEFGLRPSQVVSRDRDLTQRWARQIYDTGAYSGVSWWSYRDPRWASYGLWRYDDARPVAVTLLTSLGHPFIRAAADVLLRQLVA